MKKVLGLMVAGLVAMGSVMAASAAPNGISFFQDINYLSSSTANIPEGDYELADLERLGFINDWASSVNIPSGWTVQLFEKDGYDGNSWLLTTMDSNSENFVNFGANDVVSSAKVRNGVTFYQDIDYKGSSTIGLKPGSYTLSDLQYYGFINDWASSVSIPNGWAVDLYTDDNFQGECYTLDQIDFNSSNFVNFNANDIISSVRVRIK